MQNNPAQAVFAQWDRGSQGATRLVFLNNGGRSRLIMTAGSRPGDAKELGPVFHKRIASDTIDEAHAYAKSVYGRRADWPVRITIDRPGA